MVVSSKPRSRNRWSAASMMAARVRSAFEVVSSAPWSASVAMAWRGDPTVRFTLPKIGPPDRPVPVLVHRSRQQSHEHEPRSGTEVLGDGLPPWQRPGTHQPGPFALVHGAVGGHNGEDGDCSPMVEVREPRYRVG